MSGTTSDINRESMIMIVRKQIDGLIQWMTRDWDRGLHANIAQLAVDVDDAIAALEVSVIEQPTERYAHKKLTEIRKRLNKAMEVIALESTTPRFTKQSTKAIDLIWSS